MVVLGRGWNYSFLLWPQFASIDHLQGVDNCGKTSYLRRCTFSSIPCVTTYEEISWLSSLISERVDYCQSDLLRIFAHYDRRFWNSEAWSTYGRRIHIICSSASHWKLDVSTISDVLISSLRRRGFE